MACKNCAAMKTPRPTLKPLFALLSLLALLAAVPAQAEKADRGKAMVFTFDKQGEQDPTHVELVGNVVITKGSMLLQAERVNGKQTPDGYWQLFALSQADKQVSFRQSLDIPGEFIEGFADQVEYDAKADIVRFTGHAILRQMRGTLVVKEANGPLITYNNRTEQIKMETGEGTRSGDRGRLVVLPPDAGASAPAAPASAVPLQPSTTLQTRKPS